MSLVVSSQWEPTSFNVNHALVLVPPTFPSSECTIDITDKPGTFSSVLSPQTAVPFHIGIIDYKSTGVEDTHVSRLSECYIHMNKSMTVMFSLSQNIPDVYFRGVYF